MASRKVERRFYLSESLGPRCSDTVFLIGSEDLAEVPTFVLDLLFRCTVTSEAPREFPLRDRRGPFEGAR